ALSCAPARAPAILAPAADRYRARRDRARHRHREPRQPRHAVCGVVCAPDDRGDGAAVQSAPRSVGDHSVLDAVRAAVFGGVSDPDTPEGTKKKMRNPIITTVVACLAATAAAPLAFAQGRGGQPVQPIQPVKPGLFVVAGAGANALVRVTPDGVILI